MRDDTRNFPVDPVGFRFSPVRLSSSVQVELDGLFGQSVAVVVRVEEGGLTAHCSRLCKRNGEGRRGEEGKSGASQLSREKDWGREGGRGDGGRRRRAGREGEGENRGKRAQQPSPPPPTTTTTTHKRKRGEEERADDGRTDMWAGWLGGRGEGKGRRSGGGRRRRRRRAALHGNPTYLGRSDDAVGGAVGSNSGETVRQSLTLHSPLRTTTTTAKAAALSSCFVCSLLACGADPLSSPPE